MPPELFTIGGLTVDNAISADGIVALAQAGGNGAYSAIGALLWSDRVGLVSHAVATYPRDVIARLEAGGIDLRGVRWTDARLTVCNWFIHDAEGRRDEGLQSPPEALAEAGFPTDRLSPAQVDAWRTHLHNRRVPGEVSYSQFRVTHPLEPDQIPGDYLRARGAHLAPSQPEVMTAMLDLLAPTGMVITADPGHQLADQPLEAIAPILSRIDAFLPSEVELRALVPGAGLAEALSVLARHCKDAVAVKLGPEGVLVWDRARNEAVAVPAVQVAALDPTGAGDSFSGGFLAGLARTGDPVAAARFGAISAALTVQHFGADGALPLDRAGAEATLRALTPKVEMTPG